MDTRRPSPLQLVLLGIVLMFIGVLVPFATLLGLVEGNLYVEMASYLASVAGLAIGAIGVIQHSRTSK